MTVQRLSEMYSETVREAIEQVALGDDFAWEVGIVGTPEGLIFAVLIQTPSPVLGTGPIQANIALGKGMKTEVEEMRAQVIGAVENMRQARTQLLSQENGAQLG